MKSGRFGFCLLAMLFAVGAAVCSSQSSHAQDPTQTNRSRRAEARPSPTPETTERSDEVVRVDTSLTNVLFTAADKQNRFLTNITREDVRILEDGVPQEIFTFQPNIDLPLSLAVLIDTSRSEEFTLPDEKAAARSFLEAVMRANKDEAAIISFTGEVTLEQGLTGNVDRLRHAIDRVEYVQPSGSIGGGVVVGTPPISSRNQMLAGSTAIWDAVYATSRELLSDSAIHTRRAIILLTDGVDTSSQVKMSEAIDRALKADALIYAVGIGDRYRYSGVDSGSLNKITERTGGRAYFPRNERDLRDAFEQIQRELREQYLIAYSPSNKSQDGTYRRVTIEITNPDLRKSNPRLTYRPGYFARGGATSSPTRP